MAILLTVAFVVGFCAGLGAVVYNSMPHETFEDWRDAHMAFNGSYWTMKKEQA